MTSTIAFIGKSGSGKTTLAKAFLKLLKKNFPNNSILLVDNDLTLELSDNFGIKSKNTIYGIKSGKHEYKTGIPEGMSKQEYIEWALEDIIIEIDENIDMLTSWFVTPKDCHCPSTKLMRDSLAKLVKRYDFVIFDCEYDLRYLNLLVDCPINVAAIISKSNKYIDDTTPWSLAKDDTLKDRLQTVIYNLLESIRVCAIQLQPFLPNTGCEILRQLNIEDDSNKYNDANNYNTIAPSVLFARIDKEEKLKEIEQSKENK